MIGFPGRLHFLWQPGEQGWCSWRAAGQGEWEPEQPLHQHEISSRCPSEDVCVFPLLFRKANEMSPWEVPDA